MATCLGPPRPVRRGVTDQASRNLEGGEEETCVVCLLGAQDLQGLIMWGRERIRDPLCHGEWLLVSKNGVNYVAHITGVGSGGNW